MPNVDIILTMGALIGVGLIAAFHVGLSKSLRASRQASTHRGTQMMDKARVADVASQMDPAPSVAGDGGQLVSEQSLSVAEPGPSPSVTFDPVTRVATSYSSSRMPPEVEAAFANLAFQRDTTARDQLYAAVAAQLGEQSAAMALSRAAAALSENVGSNVDALRKLLNARKELVTLVNLSEVSDGPQRDLLERVEAEIRSSGKSLGKPK
jgi:hypothetical protein